MANSQWLQAKILNRYYNRIAAAAQASGTCPQIAKFGLGYGYVNETQSPPELSSIPGTIAAVPSEFYTGIPVFDYSGGTLSVQCSVPQGTFGSPVKCNFAGLYDQDDILIAAAVYYPDWISPEDDWLTNVYIVFPVE